MAQTIPGGAYRGTDGRWHDANGRLLPSSAARQAEELHARRTTENAQAPLPAVAAETPPAAAPLAQGPVGPQSMAPVLPDREAPAPRARRGRKS
jgi:hypothetical protein